MQSRSCGAAVLQQAKSHVRAVLGARNENASSSRFWGGQRGREQKGRGKEKRKKQTEGKKETRKKGREKKEKKEKGKKKKLITKGKGTPPRILLLEVFSSKRSLLENTAVLGYLSLANLAPSWRNSVRPGLFSKRRLSKNATCARTCDGKDNADAGSQP